jgi:hypothetical protein
MTKPLGGICPIVIRQCCIDSQAMFYAFNFVMPLQTHFSPHQFRITTKGGCEIIIHGIWCTLDLHLDWVFLQLDVVNTFNSMSRGVIFQELHTTGGDIIQFIFFIHAFESPLFYSYHNYDDDVIIIMFTIGNFKVIIWEGHYLP